MSYCADKQVIDTHTLTDTKTGAMTIPEGQNWPLVKIEEKSTKSSQSSSKVVGLGPADLWKFPTLILVDHWSQFVVKYVLILFFSKQFRTRKINLNHLSAKDICFPTFPLLGNSTAPSSWPLPPQFHRLCRPYAYTQHQRDTPMACLGNKWTATSICPCWAIPRWPEHRCHCGLPLWTHSLKDSTLQGSTYPPSFTCLT